VKEALADESSVAGHAGVACKAAFPGYVAPCDSVLRDHTPRRDDWRYEIEVDGYRAQLHIRPDCVKVYSRTRFDWTDQFSSIAATAPQMKAETAVVDGEAVVYGKTGLPDFQQLRRELGRGKEPAGALLCIRSAVSRWGRPVRGGLHRAQVAAGMVVKGCAADIRLFRAHRRGRRCGV
jgi:ATP-dependent DNA ligase